SVELIAAAKAEGLHVTCSVTPYHLYFSDADLASYDTNLKVNPPLRTDDDREALRAGIHSGIIDFIASHHQPYDWDHKVCEFEYAKDGMEGLESVFGAAGICGISPDIFIKMQTENIRNIFGQKIPVIAEGESANLTLYSPVEEFIFEEKQIFSLVKNNAFIGNDV